MRVAHSSPTGGHHASSATKAHRLPTPDLKTAIAAHLADWGLRRFESDAAYDRWQRAVLQPEELATLFRLSEQRGGGTDPAAEVAFYDRAAHAHILPVLYSQRYDYYVTVGTAVAERIGNARVALDVGCGVGILTTFYARQYPACVFVGIDRSPASIAAAQAKAAALGLTNVRFECGDVERTDAAGPFDLIVATHALLQSERDPGVPSLSWQTFERARDPAAQADFERRTGLGPRLDRLCAWLTDHGRLIVFEKTSHLARRVPFQRALAARGLLLLENPVPVRYAVIEDLTDDGPLYVLSKTGAPAIAWDESPEQADATVNWTALASRSVPPDEPLYENHTPAAQQVWASLPNRRILQETTRQKPDGRQVHIELGESRGFLYLYCANTFDQRQLVLVEPRRAGLLRQYYAEVLQGLETTEDRNDSENPPPNSQGSQP